MIKNLSIQNLTKQKIRKIAVHNIVGLLKNELNCEILSLSIVFVGEAKIHELNKKYLRHDYSTDIITFDYSEEKYMLDGEIFISLDDAFDNSERYQVDFKNEILRLIAHGILHMIGYDDINIKDKRKMKKIENKLVLKFSPLVKKDIANYDLKNR